MSERVGQIIIVQDSELLLQALKLIRDIELVRPPKVVVFQALIDRRFERFQIWVRL